MSKVTIVDDKKEKYMSVMASYSEEILAPMHSASFEVIAYGKDECEAREMLKLAIQEISAKLEII